MKSLRIVCGLLAPMFFKFRRALHRHPSEAALLLAAESLSSSGLVPPPSCKEVEHSSVCLRTLRLRLAGEVMYHSQPDDAMLPPDAGHERRLKGSLAPLFEGYEGSGGTVDCEGQASGFNCPEANFGTELDERARVKPGEKHSETCSLGSA